MPTNIKNLPGAVRSPSRATSNGGGARRVGRLARQRRPAWIAGGVAFVVCAVVVSVSMLQSVGQRVSVVRVMRNVPIGQPITRADVGTARVAADAGVATIPGRQLGEVVGRRAAVDLRAGTLLAATQVTTQLTPQPGQALVSVSLKAGQVPPGLTPGSQVRVVATPGVQGQDTGAGAGEGEGEGAAGVKTTPADVAATVDQVSGPGEDGSMTVSLLVADANGSAVAREASTGNVALVVTARAGG